MKMNRQAVFASLLLRMLVMVLAVGCVRLHRVTTERLRLQSLIDELVVERASLIATEANYQDLCRKEKAYLRTVMSNMRVCRDMLDIPDFGGKRIVSCQIGPGDWFFYAPEGKHSIVIRATCTVSANRPAPATTKATLIKPFTREWRVPLVAHAGFHLSLSGCSFESEPFSWKLSCNRKEFRQHGGALALPAFDASPGTAFGSMSTVEFPNQISGWQYNEETMEIEPDTRVRFKANKVGAVGHQNLEVTFEGSFESAGPWVLPADQLQVVQRIGYQTLDNPKLKYVGDGRHQILHVERSTKTNF